MRDHEPEIITFPERLVQYLQRNHSFQGFLVGVKEISVHLCFLAPSSRVAHTHTHTHGGPRKEHCGFKHRLLGPHVRFPLFVVSLVSPDTTWALVLFQGLNVQNPTLSVTLGEASPFFPGILLFRKPSKIRGKQRSVLEKKDG